MQSRPSISARDAAAFLGVKAQTLYAYASRGLLRRVGTGKRRQYLVEDLERLQARQRARSGHGPVAAAALSFGEPVLDTRITGIDQHGPLYRGRSAVELASQGVGFEAVAELLWSGELPATAPLFPPLGLPRAARACASLDELLLALPLLVRALQPTPARARDSELHLARRLVRGLAELALPPDARGRSGKLAASLAPLARARRADAIRAIDLALTLVADHELNASSFAARVAASTGASLPACVTAALATLTGPRHGGACDRVEALLDEAATLRRPSDVVDRRSRRGEVVPGFGHPLYPRGDPRAPPLLAAAAKVARRRAGAARAVAPALAIAKVMERQGLPATVDLGLVALARALRMRPGAAALLLALGRSAGWVAHVLEQRESEAVLRPRARYLGP
ncbi:MAG TPA: citrate synthase family protein [Polyangia bacterium]|nr:citrate synthase family protein [Polyangia bacterium]